MSTPKRSFVFLLLFALMGCSTPPASQAVDPTGTGAPAPSPTSIAAETPPADLPTPGTTDGPAGLPGLVPALAAARVGKGAISALAAGPDFLVVGSSVGICIYDLPDMDERWCAATPRAVVSLALTADGTRLAAGLEAGYLLIWDLAARSELANRRINTYEGPLSLDFSPDGSLLAANTAGDLAIWNGFDLSESQGLSTDPAFNGQVAFSPDGRYLAWIDHPSTTQYLEIYDLVNAERAVLIELPHWSRSLAWKPDSSLIMVGQAGEIGCYENCDTVEAQTTQGGLFLYDLVRQEQHTINFNMPDAAVDQIAFSPDGVQLAIRLGAANPQIMLLDQFDAQPEPIPAVPHPYLRQMTWDRAGTTLFFINVVGGIHSWSLTDQFPADVTPPGYGSRTWIQALSPDGSRFASFDFYAGARLQIRSIPGGELLADPEPPLAGDLLGLRWSPDGSRLGLLGYNSAQVYEYASGSFTPLLALEPATEVSLYDLRWTPDGSRIIVGVAVYRDDGLQTNTFRVLDSFSGELLIEIEGAGQPYLVGPDGASLLSHRWAAEGASSELSVFDLLTGSLVDVLTLDFGLYSFTLVPGDTTLIAFQDNDLFRFSLPAGEETWRTGLSGLHIDELGYERILVSPDGRLLATAGRQVAIWDAATGELLKIFTGHTGLVMDLAFSANGKQLVTASEDGTVIVWALP